MKLNKRLFIIFFGVFTFTTVKANDTLKVLNTISELESFYYFKGSNIQVSIYESSIKTDTTILYVLLSGNYGDFNILDSLRMMKYNDTFFLSGIQVQTAIDSRGTKTIIKSKYKKNMKEGLLIAFLDNIAIEKTQYLKGVLNGISRGYSPTGELLTILTYNKGILDGTNINFYKNGNIKNIIWYDMSIPTKQNYYNADGGILGEITYDSLGNEIYKIQYYNNGEVAYKGNYTGKYLMYHNHKDSYFLDDKEINIDTLYSECMIEEILHFFNTEGLYGVEIKYLFKKGDWIYYDNQGRKIKTINYNSEGIKKCDKN